MIEHDASVCGDKTSNNKAGVSHGMHTELIKQALVTASKKDFLLEIDTEVGDPLPEETRAQYIQRGKDNVVAMLIKHFM